MTPFFLSGSDIWSTLKGRLPGVPHADTLVLKLYVRFRLISRYRFFGIMKIYYIKYYKPKNQCLLCGNAGAATCSNVLPLY